MGTAGVQCGLAAARRQPANNPAARPLPAAALHLLRRLLGRALRAALPAAAAAAAAGRAAGGACWGRGSGAGQAWDHDSGRRDVQCAAGVPREPLVLALQLHALHAGLPAGAWAAAWVAGACRSCACCAAHGCRRPLRCSQWRPGSAGAHHILDEFVRSGRLKVRPPGSLALPAFPLRRCRCLRSVHPGQEAASALDVTRQTMHANETAPPGPLAACSPQAFDADRAKADRMSTSRLSPHIHYGGGPALRTLLPLGLVQSCSLQAWGVWEHK